MSAGNTTGNEVVVIERSPFYGIKSPHVGEKSKVQHSRNPVVHIHWQGERIVKEGGGLPLMRALPFMAASGRSSSEEDMTMDARELFNRFETRIEFAKAVPEVKGLEKKERGLEAWLKVGRVFTADSGE